MKRYRERAEEIAGVLRGLPGAGQVHARSRVTGRDWQAFVARFTDGKRVAGWTVARSSGEQGGDDGADAYWLDRWTLVRICGVHDATESEFAFQESLDDAVVWFRDNPGGLSFGTVVGELKLRVIEERLFGEAVCHVAECGLVVAMDINQLVGGGAA
ncbi:MAG TPA: hypothetical protein VGC13_22295 [Longimicrobium sp.]|jgi:hypothetical protein|uniref:hypothetical protein n=1 Tax=Longimicrobium sp. TaxID=2029185 RepID=UPI002ED9774E